MAALNMQTAGLSMQMNETLFEECGGCGYVPKPAMLRDLGYKMSVHDKQARAQREKDIKLLNFFVFGFQILVAHKLELEIISAQLLQLLSPSSSKYQAEKFERASVVVDLYDLPNDTFVDVHRVFSTSTSGNGMNMFFASNKIVFEKAIFCHFLQLLPPLTCSS